MKASSDFDAEALINKYKAGTCTEDEKLLVETWYEELPDSNTTLDTAFIENDLAEVWGKLKTDIKPKKRLFSPAFMIKAAAVVTAGLLVFGGAFYTIKQPDVKKTRYANVQIKPGTNKATLTLEDGKTILLDKVSEGRLSTNSHINITKTADGHIACQYSPVPNQKTDVSGIHRIATPIGGQYQVTLPDGSKAWLNAASSITYSLDFGEKDRKVDMTGEVYFEIAKNRRKPFRVSVNNMQIKVLGTHFNVSAYQEEQVIATTLFEGAVELTTPKDHIKIKPGELANWNKGKAKIEKKPADLEQALAWKNGYFVFNDENIQDIMLKLCRWYDVEVGYIGNSKGLNFSAKISRRSNISEILEILQSTGTIKFKLQGRRIIVTS